MSKLEITTPEPRTISDKLADEILEAIRDSETAQDVITSVEELLAAVPRLKKLDGLLDAVEHAFNDCQMVLNGTVIADDVNTQATMDSLDDAFRKVTGIGCREFTIIQDEEDEEAEPEDDDTDEIEQAPPADVL
jgi:hypothetical protein